MKNKTLKIFIWGLGSLIGVAVLTTLFYGFLIYPKQIEAQCDREARQTASKNMARTDHFEDFERMYKFYYQSCLKQN